jgi:hypothetical protein
LALPESLDSQDGPEWVESHEEWEFVDGSAIASTEQQLLQIVRWLSCYARACVVHQQQEQPLLL